MFLGATRPAWSHASFLVSQAVLMLLLALSVVNLVRFFFGGALEGLRSGPRRPWGTQKHGNPRSGRKEVTAREWDIRPAEPKSGQSAVYMQRIEGAPLPGAAPKRAPTLRGPLLRYR